MTLAGLLPPPFVVELRAARKAAVLAEMARLVATGAATGEAAIREALDAREALGSTGVGAGLALPHARLARLERPVAAFARLSKRCDWRAIDGAPVDLVLLLLSPASDDAAHLAALAAFTRRLRGHAVAAGLRAAPDAAAMHRLLTEDVG